MDQSAKVALPDLFEGVEMPPDKQALELMNEGILAAIGNTPLIKLCRIFKDIRFNLFAKLESLNPGGSIKDRSALYIIKHGIETGLIKQGTFVVESSSGNMGIGLAQACAYFGLQFICVIDSKTTQQNIDVLKTYGAQMELVRDPDPVTGEFLPSRIKRVQELLSSIEHSFWPNQYANVYSSVAQYQTMREIAIALANQVDYLFCATSTCGTISGCAEYIRDHNLKTKIFAVDAIGSVIFGGSSAKRLIPGHGAALVPPLFRPGLADQCVYVSDLDCVVGCRRLVGREVILAGGSSGGVLMAIDHARAELSPGSNCVAIFPDRGERYLNTIYSDAWVEEHFGDVSHLWQSKNLTVEQACLMATQ
jgi:2,3-diaminopropionate biosynthesis protein SbnA